jgi:predicted nucleotide-binding protein (sugar kinase/HSP70/actin superfamily)
MTLSFPHLADYYIPVAGLLQSLFPASSVVPPPPITRRTLELGALHSPDFVCVPFKYNLGNFIEALESGADVLVQAGGGCRFGFYGALQEEILRGLGYKFRFVRLFGNDGLRLRDLHATVKELGGRSGYPRLIYELLLALKKIRVMDNFDRFVRVKAGFEETDGAFENIKKDFHEDLKETRGFRALKKLERFYVRQFQSVKIDKPVKFCRVGIIGELYDTMEPFANKYIEKELMKNRIAVYRPMNATYLLNRKKNDEKQRVKAAHPYLKYAVGADGAFNVAFAKQFAEAGFDGLVHIKPFGCTPEVNAMPALHNIQKDYRIPILYLSFDAQTGDTGVQTRLEAFCDMVNEAGNKRAER